MPLDMLEFLFVLRTNHSLQTPVAFLDDNLRCETPIAVVLDKVLVSRRLCYLQQKKNGIREEKVS